MTLELPLGNPRDIDGFIRQLERLRRTMPAAQEHLNEQASAITDLRARAYDNTRTSTADIPDPTSNTAAAYEHLDHAERDMLGTLHTIGLAIKLANENTDRAFRTRASTERITTKEGPTGGDCIGISATQPCPDHNWSAVRRNIHTGETTDDGRCVDCGPAHDLERYERDQARAADTAARRARRYRTAVA